MTGLIRKATLIVVALAVPGAAMASPPNWATSSIPSQISLVGVTGACVPDPAGTVTFIIRDANNTPLAARKVLIDFSACADVALGSGPGVACPSTVSGVTDGFGRVDITVAGFGNGTGPPRAANPCATVTVFHGSTGFPFPNLSVSTFDRDGMRGVGASDLSLVIRDFLDNPEAGRSDFNGDGHVGGEDLSLWISVFIRGGSAVSVAPCGSPC